MIIAQQARTTPHATGDLHQNLTVEPSPGLSVAFSASSRLGGRVATGLLHVAVTRPDVGRWHNLLWYGRPSVERVCEMMMALCACAQPHGTPVDNAEAASKASVILERTRLISQIHPGRTRKEP